MTLKELLEKKAALVNQARGIMDNAEKEKRELSEDEQRQVDEIMADVNKFRDDIDKQEDILRRKEWLTKEVEDLDTTRGRQTDLQRADKAQDKQSEKRTFRMRNGQDLILEGPRATRDYEANFRSYLMEGERTPVEIRTTLQQDSDTKGGFLVPELFAAELLMDLDNLLWMRQLCTKQTLRNGQSIGRPSLDTDVDDPEWTSELGTGSEDTSMAFGKREMKSYPLAKRIKVSRTLIRNSPISVEQLIRQRFAFKFGAVQENAYLNGTGANQPLGVFTASSNGISTSRDVSSGNTTTEIRMDGLKRAVYTITMQYRRNLAWIFHRTGVQQVSLLKDGNGRYLWQDSTQVGQPDRLLTYPVYESEYAPSTFTASQYVGLLGNFAYYWVLDALDMEIQTLVELYAATNELGYIARYEGDGAPIDQNAFARVKLAAS